MGLASAFCEGPGFALGSGARRPFSAGGLPASGSAIFVASWVLTAPGASPAATGARSNSTPAAPGGSDVAGCDCSLYATDSGRLWGGRTHAAANAADAGSSDFVLSELCGACRSWSSALSELRPASTPAPRSKDRKSLGPALTPKSPRTSGAAFTGGASTLRTCTRQVGQVHRQSKLPQFQRKRGIMNGKFLARVPKWQFFAKMKRLPSDISAKRSGI